MNIQKHLSLLGLKVEDKVTGFKGVVTCVSFDLFGCVQAVINPGVDDKGKTQEQAWFDVSRLHIVREKPVMERPNFEFCQIAQGLKGAAEKPLPTHS